MYPNVSLQAARIGEGFSTLLADMLFLIIVQDHMMFQLRSRNKQLFTHITLQFSSTHMWSH